MFDHKLKTDAHPYLNYLVFLRKEGGAKTLYIKKMQYKFMFGAKNEHKLIILNCNLKVI